MAEREWDVPTLDHVIREALKARDFPAVVAGIKVMATIDAEYAQAILDEINLGLDIAKELNSA